MRLFPVNPIILDYWPPSTHFVVVAVRALVIDFQLRISSVFDYLAQQPDQGLVLDKSLRQHSIMLSDDSQESSAPSLEASCGDESSHDDDTPSVSEVIEHSKDPMSVEKSLEFKTRGNAALLAGKYLAAISFYSSALEHTPSNAIVLSNRAQAYIKVENYGVAILDADAAIKHDPSYAKGFYRRATANFALHKFKLARKDFRSVCKLIPKDRDARARLNACEKAMKEEAFSKAIMSEEMSPLSMTYDPTNIPIDVGYDGPHPHPAGQTDDADDELALFQPGKLPLEFVMVRSRGSTYSCPTLSINGVIFLPSSIISGFC